MIGEYQNTEIRLLEAASAVVAHRFSSSRASEVDWLEISTQIDVSRFKVILRAVPSRQSLTSFEPEILEVVIDLDLMQAWERDRRYWLHLEHYYGLTVTKAESRPPIQTSIDVLSGL